MDRPRGNNPRAVVDFEQTAMDAETLTFLLRHGHINVPDRIARGLWPHPPIPFEDVVAHLCAVIRSTRWFPWPFCPWQPGEAVAEGGVIERQSDHRFVYHYQRPHPTNPYVLAERSEKFFRSAEAAARHYLKWDLYLPGNLDGWKVIP